MRLLWQGFDALHELLCQQSASHGKSHDTFPTTLLKSVEWESAHVYQSSGRPLWRANRFVDFWGPGWDWLVWRVHIGIGLNETQEWRVQILRSAQGCQNRCHLACSVSEDLGSLQCLKIQVCTMLLEIRGNHQVHLIEHLRRLPRRLGDHSAWFRSGDRWEKGGLMTSMADVKRELQSGLSLYTSLG